MSNKNIIDDVYINFLYNNFYNLVKLNHVEKKGFKNDGAIIVNMSNKRIKSGEIVVNFMPLELFPTNIVEKFSYDPNDKTKEYLIINTKPIDHVICESNDYLYIVLQIGEEGKEECIFSCSCEKLSKNKFSYVFRHEIEKKKDVSNDNMAWTLDKTERGEKYVNFCKNSINDGMIYDGFRSSPDFTNVIVSGEEWQGVAYADKIIKEYRYVLKNIEKLRKNDSIGHPKMYNFENIGMFSPLTLRHINSYCEIKKEFGGFENKNIIEIGSSYGGLCNIINILSNNEYRTYTLVDIPEVLEFSKKFLTDLNVDMTKLDFMTMKELEEYVEICSERGGLAEKYIDNLGWDLLISEFTISEMNSKMVSFYFNNVAQYCKNAYLAMNIWDSVNKKIFKKALKKLFQAVYEKNEYPVGEWPNYLLFCHK
jgi:putative sugar O-methyltransferase